jgi:hypothetical protein
MTGGSAIVIHDWIAHAMFGGLAEYLHSSKNIRRSGGGARGSLGHQSRDELERKSMAVTISTRIPRSELSQLRC